MATVIIIMQMMLYKMSDLKAAGMIWSDNQANTNYGRWAVFEYCSSEKLWTTLIRKEMVFSKFHQVEMSQSGSFIKV